MGSTGVTLPPLGLKQLSEAYASGSTSPGQLVQALYPRLAATKGIFIHLASLDDLMARAVALEAMPAAGRGPLWGVPFATKDNVDVAGMPTTAACPAFSYIPDKSAAAVQALEDAGEQRVMLWIDGVQMGVRVTVHLSARVFRGQAVLLYYNSLRTMVMYEPSKLLDQAPAASSTPLKYAV